MKVYDDDADIDSIASEDFDNDDNAGLDLDDSISSLDLDECKETTVTRKRIRLAAMENWNDICTKFSNPNIHSDVVDLNWLKIVENNGVLEETCKRDFGEIPMRKLVVQELSIEEIDQRCIELEESWK
jgi:hypothetical protein